MAPGAPRVPIRLPAAKSAWSATRLGRAVASLASLGRVCSLSQRACFWPVATIDSTAALAAAQQALGRETHGHGVVRLLRDALQFGSRQRP